MTFSKQDLYTFLIGLGAACAITLGEALAVFDAAALSDIGTWGTNLGVGFLTATGRYLVTYLAVRGFSSD